MNTQISNMLDDAVRESLNIPQEEGIMADVGFLASPEYAFLQLEASLMESIKTGEVWLRTINSLPTNELVDEALKLYLSYFKKKTDFKGF